MGAWQLKALLLMVLRQTEGPIRCMEEEDLREQAEGVVYRRSGRYGGTMRRKRTVTVCY